MPAATKIPNPAANILSAGERVFAIPELFGQILENVDFRDLLVNCNRVSRSFHDGIKHAPPSVERKLHLLPDPACDPLRLLPILPRCLVLVYVGNSLLGGSEDGSKCGRRVQLRVRQDPSITDDVVPRWRKMTLVQGSFYGT